MTLPELSNSGGFVQDHLKEQIRQAWARTCDGHGHAWLCDVPPDFKLGTARERVELVKNVLLEMASGEIVRDCWGGARD